MRTDFSFSIGMTLCLAGCTSDPPKVQGPPRRPASTVEALANQGIERLKKEPWCLYWVDQEKRQLWRMSIDGTIKELVVDYGGHEEEKGSRNELHGHNRRSPLKLEAVPNGGWIVVEPTPFSLTKAEPPTPADFKRQGSGPISVSSTFSIQYAESAQDSPWAVHYRTIPEGTTVFSRALLSEVALSRPDTPRIEYVFASNITKVCALLDSDVAILYDRPRVVLWDLIEDRKYLLFESQALPAVWPRDLRKKERFAPEAYVGRPGVIEKSWRMQRPDDINPEGRGSLWPPPSRKSNLGFGP